LHIASLAAFSLQRSSSVENASRHSWSSSFTCPHISRHDITNSLSHSRKNAYQEAVSLPIGSEILKRDIKITRHGNQTFCAPGFAARLGCCDTHEFQHKLVIVCDDDLFTAKRNVNA
jgi:hypothetical protein